MQEKRKELFQAIIVFLVIAAAVFVAIDQTLPPSALPADAAVTEFSAGRAMEHIKKIAQQPRQVGEPGFELAREYVMETLKEWGLDAQLQQTEVTVPQAFLSYYGWDIEPTRKVENILARMEGSASQDAVLLVAHLDSTGGPGASDDAHGVAVLLETARALLAGPQPRNTIIFLFTAPEETGLHGSAAFILEHPWSKQVKLVINFDAGGLSGPSELTNLSPRSGWLIRNLAKADPYVFASSGYGAGDSDFNTFRFYGFSGYAFDYARDRRKHTAFDTIENLNPASIQHQGYHALSLAHYFGNLDSLTDTKEPDPIFFNILRLGLLHYSQGMGIVITVICSLVFAGVMAVGIRKKLLTSRGIGLGTLVFLVSLVTAPLLVRIFWAILSNTVPTYEVKYYGHAVNEPLLLALFTSMEMAIISTWYALLQIIKRVNLPDLTMGALALLFVAMVALTITSPESSYSLTWSLLITLLANGFWFYSIRKDSNAFSAGQIIGFLVATIVTIVLFVPGIYMIFTGSNTDDLFLSMVMLVITAGLLVAPLHIITRPCKWWLAIAAATAALIFLGVAIWI
jgi:hypothetical protein